MLDATQAIENYIRYKNDKWAFLTECCFTKDEVNIKEPIKLMPDKEYLQLYAMLWDKYPLLAVPKTRRMTLSWTTICLYLHDTIFNRVRNNAFVSKKEDDANDLVLRAKFVFDHIPEDKIPKEMLPKYSSKFNTLDFPEIDSKIRGYPQGADQLRQFTFSGIFGDESAFWEQAEEFYSATFPTIDGGGRMTLVSSPAPGFFKRLCFDALNIVGDINVAEHTPNYTSPMQGVRLWLNKRNRFAVLELHYTSDPTKRDPSYKESIKNSMPLMKYLREYELEWDTFSGQPVYPEFNQSIHVLHKEPQPSFGLPMLIAWDFGLTPAAVVGQFEGNTLTVFKEFTGMNIGAERFVPQVVAQLRIMFPEFGDLKKNWRCWVDPSGFNRNDNDERKTADTVAKNGFNPIPGGITWEGRRQSVADLLTKLDAGSPCFQIYEKGCPVLVKGFKGGYHYPEKDIEIAPNKLRPVKNMASHPHDSLQYICGGIKSIRVDYGQTVPSPSYSKEVRSNGRI
jgi:hypothetical protein